MKKILLLSLIFCCFQLSAQQKQADADFLNKIKPEYRLDLSKKNTTDAVVAPSKATLEEELRHCEEQLKQVKKQLLQFEAAEVNSKDPDYVKMQLARKYWLGEVDRRKSHLRKLNPASNK